MRHSLKKIVENVPYPIGSILAKVPFEWRFGSAYTQSLNEIKLGAIDGEYVVNNFRKIFEYAKVHLPFYQDLYSKANILNLKINSLSDIHQVPIVTKNMIRSQLNSFNGSKLLNTGGSSGEPFAFYVDENAFAREWAHMHNVWTSIGYDYQDVKLTLRGKNLGLKPYHYNPVHNEFIINTYLPLANFVDDIIGLIDRHQIRFLHGYPSAIYIFLKELEQCGNSVQIASFRKTVDICLLGSEYPVPYMTQYLTNFWGLKYISWYGHSEMCIYAYDEFCNNHYKPFHSYGYAEVVDERLIGTSYHNQDMPLIRYDTGDIVNGEHHENGLLATFSIMGGRSGDYIIDKNNKSIPLTALIFGRHHDAFTHLKSVQVRQCAIGSAEILVTSDKIYNNNEILEMFDLTNTDIDFRAKLLNQPILTEMGKMPLLVDI